MPFSLDADHFYTHQTKDDSSTLIQELAFFNWLISMEEGGGGTQLLMEKVKLFKLYVKSEWRWPNKIKQPRWVGCFEWVLGETTRGIEPLLLKPKTGLFFKCFPISMKREWERKRKTPNTNLSLLNFIRSQGVSLLSLRKSEEIISLHASHKIQHWMAGIRIFLLLRWLFPFHLFIQMTVKTARRLKPSTPLSEGL